MWIVYEPKSNVMKYTTFCRGINWDCLASLKEYLLLLHLVGCLYYIYQWCTVKQISDNEIYLLIKYKVVQIWPGLICTNVHTNQSRSYLNHLVHKKRSLESSETPVLYRGRTVPKGYWRNFVNIILVRFYLDRIINVKSLRTCVTIV